MRCWVNRNGKPDPSFQIGSWHTSSLELPDCIEYCLKASKANPGATYTIYDHRGTHQGVIKEFKNGALYEYPQDLSKEELVPGQKAMPMKLHEQGLQALIPWVLFGGLAGATLPWNIAFLLILSLVILKGLFERKPQ